MNKKSRQRKIERLQRKIAQLEEQGTKSPTKAIPEDESFSMLCSDVFRIICSESDAAIDHTHEHIWTPWPSRRFQLRVVGRLARGGYTVRKFMAKATQQTSKRWTRFGPFSILARIVDTLDDPSPR